ncbi:vomeronasal type-1 receptor 42-like [Tachyglossus aculeatus]|uniref:vomeronasal type-1 receptor 42-like n=1 Tax=Tachyglossus aculeatus TaxID=9261 RepID=UPI0018F3FF19|nr:vomeronasal type-1 receptor 42-like [Tachyglossus aculeatus]
MPELRAPRKVVALATFYVLLRRRQTIMFSVFLNMKEKPSLLVNRHMVLGFMFSTISPLLMIHSTSFCPPIHEPKPTDLIITHLALVHAMMLLTRVVKEAASAHGLHLLQADIRCKVLAFVYCATRGTSMGTTILLSVIQAMTISPSHPSWAQLNAQLVKHVFPACVIIRLINLLVEANLLIKLVSSPNVTIRENRFHGNYCMVSQKSTSISALLQGLFLTLMTVSDFLSLGLTGSSSDYIVHLLLCHSWRVRHLHGRCLTPRTSPVTQTTQTILLLVSCFVAFYSGDLVLSLFLGTTRRNDPFPLVISHFMFSGYPTVSPFVLLNHHNQITKFLGSFLGKK